MSSTIMPNFSSIMLESRYQITSGGIKNERRFQKLWVFNFYAQGKKYLSKETIMKVALRESLGKSLHLLVA